MFATANPTVSVFGNSTPASISQTSFGLTTSVTNANSNIFGSPIATTATGQSPFGTNTFGESQQQQQQQTTTSVFGVPICSPNTQSNPFVKSSPFAASGTQSNPFGNFTNPGGSIGASVIIAIDETGYSLENSLTDDEKAIYKMAQFPEGLIPLKPPTKELC